MRGKVTVAEAPEFEIGDVSPEQAWEELAADPRSVLIDVRTVPEWAFVGVPDLAPLGKSVIFAEWRCYPGMGCNPAFVSEVETRLGEDWPATAYFICRSGSRSREAAAEFSAAARQSGRRVRCFNVAEGFEGDLDANGRRGSANGWKRAGLSWKQS